MGRQSKERLLGFLLLLAIAAIFLPMLLDGEGARQGQLQAVIPERPEWDPVVHYQPKYQQHQDSTDVAPLRSAQISQLRPPPAPIEDNSQQSNSKTPAKTPTTAIVKSVPKAQSIPAAQPSAKPAVQSVVVAKSKLGTDKPMLDQQGVPAGWTLQLASFKERSNAVALQKRLQQKGYKTYIRDKGELSKVFVGPDMQKSTLEGIKRELNRTFKLDGLILRFRP